MVIVMAVSTMFLIQVVDLEAALLPNEIAIRPSSIKHGPEFGNGWSEDQRMVWNRTQEWWQLRMASDWGKLKNLYHNDAILYSYLHKVPFDVSELEELAKKKIFGVVYCTVHEIRTIENIAVVMIYYEIVHPIPPKRMVFVWMRQGADWKLITTMSKEE